MNLQFHMTLSCTRLSLAEWLCVALWTEAGLGEPGEEGVLLDVAGFGCKHPYLLHVEENGLACTAT